LRKKEALGFALLGAAVVFLGTTIVATTGLAVSFGEDEQVLMFVRMVSLLVAIGSAIGLVLS
jgi:hypothetical protein